jgi:hypothetical protein
MLGGPGYTRQTRHDHHCSNNRILALAAHSHAFNDFGSLEYPYRADRAEHNPDDTSHPHCWLHSRHKDRNDFVVSTGLWKFREDQPSLDVRLAHRNGLPAEALLGNPALLAGSSTSSDADRAHYPPVRSADKIFDTLVDCAMPTVRTEQLIRPGCQFRCGREVRT